MTITDHPEHVAPVERVRAAIAIWRDKGNHTEAGIAWADAEALLAEVDRLAAGWDSTAGLRRERDRLYEQAANDLVDKDALKAQLAEAMALLGEIASCNETNPTTDCSLCGSLLRYCNDAQNPCPGPRLRTFLAAPGPKIVTPEEFARLTAGKVRAVAKDGKLIPNPSGNYDPRLAIKVCRRAGISIAHGEHETCSYCAPPVPRARKGAQP